MSQHLPQRGSSTPSNILSREEKQLVKVLADVNVLISFKLTVHEIIDWAMLIKRLAPDIDVKAVRFVLDAFATEAIVWNKDKGIQNIFNGLKEIKKTEEGYQLVKRESWL